MNIGIIGAGKLGSCLANKFFSKNILTAITASNEKHTQEIAAKFNLVAMTNDQLVQACEVIFITVPDGKIEAIAKEIVSSKVDLMGKCFLHCSGTMGLEPLQSLAEYGADIGSIHPLQSFAGGDTELNGVYMAIAGDGRAITVAQDLVAILGGIAFSVPDEDRALYHAAACICSNYAVAVEYMAQSIMNRWMPDNDAKAGWAALKPLFKGTANNLLNAVEANTALTGPISRGDIATVEKHLAVLPEDVKELYCSLGCITTDIAFKNKTIDDDSMRKLKACLQ